MRYSIKEIKTGKSGSERVITPVRTSKRISNRSKSPSGSHKKATSSRRSTTPQQDEYTTNSKRIRIFKELNVLINNSFCDIYGGFR